MTTTMTKDEHTVSAEMADLVKRNAGDIQMLPAIAIQALEIAKDPDCSMSEFTAVVERDAKLASDILMLANSVAFCTGRQISNLHQSVVRLGFRQCRNLILSTSMASLSKKMSLQDEWIRESLCRHGFLTALIALNVNRAAAVGFQGEEFAAGLIHDFGRTLFAVALPDKFAEIDPMNFEEGEDLLASEQLVSGTTHTELGAWFAQSCHLPAELVDVIRYHHSPTCSLRHRRLCALTAVCDHMANHLQNGNSPQEYNLRDNTAVFVLEGCGVRNATGRLAETWQTIMETAARDAVYMMAA